jgi:hypothetical protein
MEMGFLDKFVGGSSDQIKSGAIDYGKDKMKGGHDHRYNTGDDRTPGQKEGDKKRSKD